MREIKFRGKTLEDAGLRKAGEWAYGGYFVDYCYGGCPEGKHHIVEFNSAFMGYFAHTRVEKESVGQFTGLKDKHGKEIYEGDICFIQIYGNFGEPSVEESFNVQVKWEGNAFHLVDADGDTWTEWATYYKGEDVEIIGNIYENPELLEQPNAN